ncbi:tRNA uridine-5-carboxymethylaminomethyl(34) synthesis GTPase MnmE, partial [candidate division TA06 bacterium]
MGVGDHTIAAISTPPGEGAIGMVRMSGGEALKIGDIVFKGMTGPSGMETHTLHYGEIC